MGLLQSWCKPYIPLGAFGGATRDIAIALGLLTEGDRSPRGEQLKGYTVAMARIRAIGSGISAELRKHLEAIVKEENAEEAAQLALGIIQRSLASSKVTQPDR
jgi:post-segregation antitoxin (ccd killing protein)